MWPGLLLVHALGTELLSAGGTVLSKTHLVPALKELPGHSPAPSQGLTLSRPLTSCVTVGRSHSLPVPGFPRYNGAGMWGTGCGVSSLSFLELSMHESVISAVCPLAARGHGESVCPAGLPS